MEKPKGNLKVKIWMMENGVKATQLADNHACSKSFISQFLKGKKTSNGLVDYMVKNGCPKKHFKNGRVAA